MTSRGQTRHRPLTDTSLSFLHSSSACPKRSRQRQRRPPRQKARARLSRSTSPLQTTLALKPVEVPVEVPVKLERSEGRTRSASVPLPKVLHIYQLLSDASLSRTLPFTDRHRLSLCFGRRRPTLETEFTDDMRHRVRCCQQHRVGKRVLDVQQGADRPAGLPLDRPAPPRVRQSTAKAVQGQSPDIISPPELFSSY